MIQQLKLQFEENIYRTGIYMITIKCKPQYFYIGYAAGDGKFPCQKGFYKRWSRHLRHLDTNIHANRFLQRLYNKHGLENLQFEIIEFCDPILCPDKEDYWVNGLKATLNLYKNKHTLSKKKLSLKTRRKIGRSMKGKKHTEETKKKISLSHMGKIHQPIGFSIKKGIIRKITKELLTGNKKLSEIKNELGMMEKRIYRNIELLYGKETINQIKQKFIKSKIKRSVESCKSQSKVTDDVIKNICNLYSTGNYRIIDIRTMINLNEDLIGRIIKENLDPEIRKQIRSKNTIRK